MEGSLLVDNEEMSFIHLAKSFKIFFVAFISVEKYRFLDIMRLLLGHMKENLNLDLV